MPEELPTAAGIPLQGRSVALVHEWFTANGGSENVFLSLGDLLPHAKRFVLWRETGAGRDAELHESWLARTPLRRSRALALPAMPIAWRTLTREHFDVVLASSHAFAHTVRIGPPEWTRYLGYIHSPARYVWSPEIDGRGSAGPLALPRKALQAVDRRLGRHLHSLAANSHEVQARIRRYWHRDARVINPPVDVEYFAGAPAGDRDQDRSYLLGVGRWIPYKRFDLIVAIAEACGAPLVIAGGGREEAALRRLAARTAVPVVFEDRPSRERLRELYWGARALVFPAHEDFGIVPVEAQACGTPVLGVRRGGLLESVVDGRTGVLVDSTDPRDFARRLPELDRLDRATIQAHATGFSITQFHARVAIWLAEEA